MSLPDTTTDAMLAGLVVGLLLVLLLDVAVHGGRGRSW